MAGLFADKTAVITGASSGIGAALAEAFAREGANLSLLARRADRLDGIKRQCEQLGAKVLAMTADVRDRGALDAAFAQTAGQFGGVDVAIANAGYGVSGPFQKMDTAAFREQFDTNVFGVIDTIYAALPHLAERQGRVAVVGSIMGRAGMPASGPYTASKFAVVGLAESLDYDLAASGVSMTLINPGLVASEIRSVNNRGEFTGKKDPAPQFLVMPADKAARQMVRAIHRRRFELVVTGHGKLTVFAARHFPRTLRFALRRLSRGRLDKIQEAKRGGAESGA